MSEEYTQDILKVVVAQICLNVGWNAIKPTSLECLVDILHRYLRQITQKLHRYAEFYNRAKSNISDVELVFKDLNLNIDDLKNYVHNVASDSCLINVPKYPVQRNSNLNILKPDSQHLLPMLLRNNNQCIPLFFIKSSNNSDDNEN